jgi:hypothetical protein
MSFHTTDGAGITGFGEEILLSSVHRVEHDIGVIEEDFLSTVTVMDIPINNHDLLDMGTPFADHVCRNSYVVEKAETLCKDDYNKVIFKEDTTKT